MPTPLSSPIVGFAAHGMPDLTADQTTDALEAACDAIFAGFRADYLHDVAPNSDVRMERHVQAYGDWQTAGFSITYFSMIPSLTPALRPVYDQLLKLLQTRLSGIYEHTIDADTVSDIVEAMKTDPGHDARLVELLADVAAYLNYVGQPGLSQPDVSDLSSGA
ncbi:hypothetical protein LGQ03_13340 [Loktanella sp. TSTF-M6]|uniref:Hemoglobin n=1 Tax=Loktanella gaetbuli TaxID=2881335 RepID=A0ABS8BX07_9RHOB|nr:hypothetical protein [Loktanella gaetbuli]MCB5200229.1 hypothetical protein [Loktanella gaetbuli]